MKVHLVSKWEEKLFTLLPVIEICFKDKYFGFAWLSWGIAFEFND